MIMGLALAGAGGWTLGYQVIAALQLGLALVFLLTLPLWQREHGVPQDVSQDERAVQRKPLNPIAPWLAASLYLVYPAIEVSTGLWSASILVEGRQLGATQAGLWVSCFFGAITFGRFAIGLIATRVGNRGLVRWGLVVALLGAALFALDSLPSTLWLVGLILLGLGCAPIYPSLMHETTYRFDADTARKVIGHQVGFAYVGVALAPATMGLLAAHLGLGAIMLVVLLAVLLLLLLSEILNSMT
jgi:fucose permease